MNFSREIPMNSLPSTMPFSFPMPDTTNWPMPVKNTNYPMVPSNGLPHFNIGYPTSGIINCNNTFSGNPWLLNQQTYRLPQSPALSSKFSFNSLCNVSNKPSHAPQDPDTPLDLTKKSLPLVNNAVSVWNPEIQSPIMSGNQALLQQYFLQLYRQSSMCFPPLRHGPLPLACPPQQGGLTRPLSKLPPWPYLGRRHPGELTQYRHSQSSLSSPHSPQKPASCTSQQHTPSPRKVDKQSSVSSWLNQETMDVIPDSSPSSNVSTGPKTRMLHQRRNCGGGGKQPVTRCFQCSKLFPSLIDLNAHFLQEHEPALMQEFELARSWKSIAVEDMCMQDLETVIRRGDTETTGYQCPHCDYFAKWPTELQKHIMVHSKERPHQCIICGLTYKWKWDLGRHFDKSHGHAANPYKKSTGEAADPRSTNATTGSTVQLPPKRAGGSTGSLLGSGVRGQRKRRLLGTNSGADQKQRRGSLGKHLPPLQHIQQIIPITMSGSMLTACPSPPQLSQLPNIHLDLLKPMNNFLATTPSHRFRLHNSSLRRQRRSLEGSSLRCSKPFSCKFCPYQSKLKTNVIRHIRKCPRVKRANSLTSLDYSKPLNLDVISDTMFEEMDDDQTTKWKNSLEENEIKSESI